MHGQRAQSAWCSPDNGRSTAPRRYVWATCLRELRVAAVFVARLRRGHGDLRFLANNVRAATGP